MIAATSRKTVRVSQRPRRARRSAGAAGAPSLQQVGDAQGEQAVDGDRGEQQRPDDGLLPEAVDAQDGERRADAREQQRAERGAVDRARAAEDRHAADDHGGDDGQLLPGARGGVDGAEARRVQRAGQPGERAADDERAEHAAPDADAREHRGIGIRADRVQLASGAVRAQVEAGDEHDRERDQREHRDPRDRVRPELEELVGHVGGVDLPARRPGEVRAADDVERAERHHERRHAPEADQRAVDGAEARADGHGDRDDQRDRDARVVGEERAGGERGEAEHRAHRQVDVAADDDDGLADGEQRDERDVEPDVAQVLRREVARLGQVGAADEQRERHEQPELAHAEDQLDDAAGPALLEDGRDGDGGGVGAHAARPRCPVAARTTDSSSASSRSSSAVRRPSCMTSTRSAIPSTSGSSEEIIRTASPWPASSLISRCTSALVPTSMPRVGSSMISSLGSVASHLASTTFCWLPPDRKPTGSPRSCSLICRRCAQSAATRRSAPRPMTPSRPSRPSVVSVALRSIERSMPSPCWRRSSGTSPMPAPIAALGDPFGSSRPPISTVPASRRSMPKIARATSLRPAPTSPARATISPRRTSKETSTKTPSRVNRETLSTVSPICASPLGNSWLSSRPTILRTSSSVDRGLVGPSWVTSPSRSTVTVEQIAKTSSRRCEMNSTPAPRSRSVSTTANSRATSWPDSAAVGSSMISTRASKDSALAISTICWSAIDMPRTG